MGISLSKIEQEAPELLSLAKGANDALSLRKLTAHTAKVALVLDYSGSMSRRYKQGEMQRVAEKALALGTQFDDDGAIDLFLFDSSAAYLGEVNINNYRGSIDRLTSGRRMGTTNYAAAFSLVEQHYSFSALRNAGSGSSGGGLLKSLFGKKDDAGGKLAPLTTPAQEPVYVIFITDGAPDNKSAAVKAITEASYSPIFWQFLSIGSESIQFLEKLDDLDGRYIDNADYKPVGEIDNLRDDQLWSLLLDEYPAWVEEQKRRGQIR